MQVFDINKIKKGDKRMAYIEGEIPVNTGNNATLAYPVMPFGGYGMGGFGGGYGFGGDAIWIILLLALFGGWGNNGWGGNGGNNMLYDINANTNRGFDNLALNNGIDSLHNTVSNGFANAEVARCNSTTNLLQAINGVNTGLLNCCCENRAGLADLKYTIATEECATRNNSTLNTRDIIENANRNSQAILDKLCQQEIDAKNDLISTLRSQLSMADLRASQVAQTAEIRANNATVANQLVSELRSCPIPAQPVYGNTPIFSCSGNGCGCGSIQ